ncbi:MAG: CoA pyrophosphatase [Herbiconiux sp.]|uniref:NUDIX hydrolase n=1 Tax=Herbiconiux sp. TaxID=1871186 RepID=UPI00120D4C86|nr:CoA pyrophosphatase [Herbiconiux sp.]TAJ46912.1 MAG: CoA pyrophosphatase [Herbiconiux sp.]
MSLSASIDRISGYAPKVAAGGPRAAVAVAVEWGSVEAEVGEPTFMLTLRTSSLRAHSGQFALPGGKIEAGETPEQAVLREVAEEIGDARWRTIGRLDDFVMRNGTVIAAFVLLHETGTAAIVPSADEVAEAYRIPIDGLHLLEEVGSHELADGSMQCSVGEFALFPPTGAIVYQFLELWATGTAPDIEQFSEPRFASK